MYIIDNRQREEQRFFIKYLWMKNWGSKEIYQELVITLGADAYGRSQIKTWLWKFRNGNLSCKDAPRTGQPPLTLGPQLVAVIQKHPFVSAQVLVRYFLTCVLMIQEVLYGGLELKILSALGARLSVPCPKGCSC
jgi:hypothetical protein